MGRCVVVLGGELSKPMDFVLSPSDYVIACDSGWHNAKTMGFPVHLLVGDFDSFQGDLPKDVEIRRAPVKKDDTDGMLAVRIALERGFEQVTLLCGLGGRLDHTIANFQTLAFLCRHGAKAELRDENTVLWPLERGVLQLEPMAGFSLSVFAWDGACSGVTLEGLAYPLTDALLMPDFPLGVSNAFTEATARITVREGMVMVMACRLCGESIKNII